MEALIATAISAVALLGLNAMQLQANRSIQDSGNRSQAIWMLEDLRNRILTNYTAIQNYDTAGAFVDCNVVPVVMCSAFHDGTDPVGAAQCTPQQTALHDLWDVACSWQIPQAGFDVSRSAPSDFVVDPRVSVDLDPLGLINNRETYAVTLTVDWVSRSKGRTDNNQTVYNTQSGQLSELRDSATLDFWITE